MFFQKCKNKNQQKTKDSNIEQKQLDNIARELTSLRSDLNKKNYANTLDEILNNLRNQDYSIISIFIIPLCYWLYNLSLEAINYGYWSLLHNTSLGFDINPAITPPIKLIMAIIFFGIGSLIFLNIKQKSEYKTAAFIFNSFILILGIMSITSLVLIKININETDFYNGVSPIRMLIFNPIILTSFLAIMLGYIFFIKIILKSSYKFYLNNIPILITALWLILTSIGLMYIFNNYFTTLQSFALNTYKQSDNYIHLKSDPKADIYLIQCDSKCFGYQIINSGEKDYGIIPLIFLPEDISYIHKQPTI